MLKHLFLFLGSLIIGFGLGLITGNYFTLSFALLWTLIITSLIGGGFILALSFRRSPKSPTTSKPHSLPETPTINSLNKDTKPSNEQPESTDKQ